MSKTVEHSQRRKFSLSVCNIVIAIALAGSVSATGAERRAYEMGDVNEDRVVAESSQGTNWLVNGQNFEGHHFTPLTQINSENVSSLGLAWELDVPSPMGFPMEPIVVDGVAFISGTLNRVFAIDLQTGKQLWVFDPQLNLNQNYGVSWAARVNRGVAVWDGTVYLGAADCRLIAIDASKGTKRWESPVCGAGLTGDDESIAFISSAPIVGGGKVYMGYGGSESGSWGSVAAFDAKTGNEVWRFWTLPGAPAEGTNAATLKTIASPTWTKGVAPQAGATVWDGIRYDPRTGYVIFGTSSAAPQNAIKRDPEERDNLFANSVIAVDAATGEYVWHYQVVPADAWNFDATMPKIVADIEKGGEQRRVVFEIGKSGFFYVLDAHSGELLAADPVVETSWASHIDLKTGRPVERPNSRFYKVDGPVFVTPSDAHMWQPMSFSPITELVYMPISEQPAEFWEGGTWGFHMGGFNDGEKFEGSGKLIAWDPRQNRERWSVSRPLPYNGGVMASAGNLVFQGLATGELEAYAADSGEKLWSYFTGSAIQATPVSYSIDNEQYVMIAVGQGSGIAMSLWTRATGETARGEPRLMAFKLGGNANPTTAPTLVDKVPKPPLEEPSEAQIAAGQEVWDTYGCEACHGYEVEGRGKRQLNGAVPDLRYATPLVHTEWHGIVLGGTRRDKGMPAFSNMGMTIEESRSLQSYVVSRAWAAFKSQNSSKQ